MKSFGKNVKKTITAAALLAALSGGPAGTVREAKAQFYGPFTPYPYAWRPMNFYNPLFPFMPYNIYGSSFLFNDYSVPCCKKAPEKSKPAPKYRPDRDPVADFYAALPPEIPEEKTEEGGEPSGPGTIKPSAPERVRPSATFVFPYENKICSKNQIVPQVVTFVNKAIELANYGLGVTNFDGKIYLVGRDDNGKTVNYGMIDTKRYEKLGPAQMMERLKGDLKRTPAFQGRAGNVIDTINVSYLKNTCEK